MLPRHLRSSILILTGAAGLGATLAWCALSAAAAPAAVAITAAVSTILLLCGFAESSLVDRIAGGRRTAPQVFFRLMIAMLLTLLSAIAVSLAVGIVRRLCS